MIPLPNKTFDELSTSINGSLMSARHMEDGLPGTTSSAGEELPDLSENDAEEIITLEEGKRTPGC